MFSTLHSISAGGRRLAYESAGQGQDVVLFVHGSGCTAAMWMPFARSLEPRMRAVMVDLLGHGHSEPLAPHELVDAEADLLLLEEVARREAASARGRVHVVGHAYGAALAARLALTQPGNSLVRSLTLIEPELYGPLVAERPADCAKELELLHAGGKLLDVATGGDEEWTKRYYDYWIGAGAWALLTPRQRELQLEVSRKSFCEVRSSWLDPRPFSDYARLPKSLLLVGGDRSTNSAKRILTRLGEVSGHVVHIVPSASHFLPITHGPELLEMTLRLWAIPANAVSLAHVGAT